jgi:hypothetical protein
MLESASNIGFREKLSYPLFMRNSIVPPNRIRETWLNHSTATLSFLNFSPFQMCIFTLDKRDSQNTTRSTSSKESWSLVLS